jgi:transcriptional regulator with XRE-family HTH domain
LGTEVSRLDDTLRLVGQRIQDVRRQRGISQTGLAEQLNISPSHMSNIETGRTNFGVDIFKRITEVLQISADYLLRSNVPAVTDIYAEEISNLISDCAPSEVEAMKNILKEMKSAFRNVKKADYD